MKKILLSVLFIGILCLINSCCSIEYPKYDKPVESSQMKLISRIFDNPKFLEKVTLDTSISTNFFYEKINQNGIDSYLDKLKQIDCNNKFMKFEQKAIKTDDSSFKQANIYYFQQKTEKEITDILFIFINLNKKWYLDELLIKND